MRYVNVGGARRVLSPHPQDGDPGHGHGLVPSDEEAGGAGAEAWSNEGTDEAAHEKRAGTR